MPADDHTTSDGDQTTPGDDAAFSLNGEANKGGTPRIKGRDSEKRKASNLAYDKANRDKRNAYAKIYRDAHKDEAKEYQASYRVKNAEKRKEYQKNYLANTAEKRKEYSKNYRETHRDEIRENHAEYRKNNREKVNTLNRKYKPNPEKVKASRIRRAYGMTSEDLAEMERQQDGRCAICRTSFAPGKIRDRHIDHDHSKGNGRDSVRGLLCGFCNTGLGMFQDDPKMLRQVIAYLRSPPGIPSP